MCDYVNGWRPAANMTIPTQVAEGVGGGCWDLFTYPRQHKKDETV